MTSMVKNVEQLEFSQNAGHTLHLHNCIGKLLVEFTEAKLAVLLLCILKVWQYQGLQKNISFKSYIAAFFILAKKRKERKRRNCLNIDFPEQNRKYIVLYSHNGLFCSHENKSNVSCNNQAVSHRDSDAQSNLGKRLCQYAI